MTTRARAALQTQHAILACDLASAFNEALKKLSLAPGDYAVELTTPAGPSTAGGVQAMQHLRLVPRIPGHPTLIAGHANHAAGKAELRTYAHLDAVHRQRFKRPLSLDRVQYEEFFGLAKQVLTMMRLEVAIVAADPSPEEPPQPPEDVDPRRAHRLSKATIAALALALVVLLVAAAGAGAWVMARHS